MEATTESTQVQAPAATKTKPKSSGNLIMDIASEIENLSKPKALNTAEKLVNEIDTEYFRLGGILNLIKKNAWWEGHPSFGAFVYENYGFQVRKAEYLIEIYENLVTKQIPWEKVAGLGWTKLKDLARILTLDNLDYWVEKASKLSVSELQAVLKSEGPKAEGEQKTTADSQTLKFKVKNDQLETIQSALSKAKAETGTEYDNVALEMICAGYLGGTISAAKAPSLLEAMKMVEGDSTMPAWKKILMTFGELYPNVEMKVVDPGE